MKHLRSLGCALAVAALAACGGAEAVAPQPEIRAQESTADGTLGSGGRKCEDTPDGCAMPGTGGGTVAGTPQMEESSADGFLGSGGRKCTDTPEGCTTSTGGGNQSSGG